MRTVPPILLQLTNNPLVDKYDISSLWKLSIGAAPVSAEMMVAFQKRFKTKYGMHITLSQGYGMSELCAYGVLGFG